MKDLFAIGNTVFSVTDMTASETIAVSIMALIIFIMFYHVAQMIFDSISSIIIATMKTIKVMFERKDELVTVDNVSNPHTQATKPMAIMNNHAINPTRKTLFRSSSQTLDEKVFLIPAYARKEKNISFPMAMK